MSSLNVLQELVITIGISLVMVYVLRLLKTPSIVSFILAGILLGPGGLGLIADRHLIESMAEIGVILLLFGVGLRFSLSELLRMKWFVFGSGGLQVVLTIAVSAAFGGLFGLGAPKAIFLGFLIALSSTAIVGRLLEEKGETQAPHGRFMISILLFQDLSVIVLMLLVPILAGRESASWQDLMLNFFQSLGTVILLILIGRFLLPRLLINVVHIRNREILMLTNIFIALGTAYIIGYLGLSLALGAFLAGIIIAESEYSYHVLGDIIPLQMAFSALFFISIGMLLDVHTWSLHPLKSLAIGFSVIFGKTLIVIAIALIFGLGLRVAVLSGFGLAQIGEFSFIIAGAGYASGLIENNMYQIFISVSVLTMILTPLAIYLSPVFALGTRRLPFLGGLISRPPPPSAAKGPEPAAPHVDLKDHVIIVGFGINGNNVARVLRHIGVKYIILELNPVTVKNVRGQGEMILYGDASRNDVLRTAKIENARSIVITIADPPAARQIVVLARHLNPKIVIIVRTRMLAEIDDLYRLGANDVIPEEFETSLEMADAILATFGVSETAIERAKTEMRAQRYGLLRRKRREADFPQPSAGEALSNPELTHLKLLSDSKGVGKSLGLLDIRSQSGAVVVAVLREGRMITDPRDDMVLNQDDVVYLFGRPPELTKAGQLLL